MKLIQKFKNISLGIHFVNKFLFFIFLVLHDKLMRSCDIELYYRNYFNKLTSINFKEIVLICSHTWII